ncbi:hypothetical protein E1B28_007231 [Marasmius oreades]|uniref:BTB domain-containing protein n=1 Tax=Marasmius oreades TaxID=181124 RepID=A0A9P7S2J8_9AGAR|nr:uncharacterized protein E1B28_007231 [Marasmius oreades]KAG7093561.1 hypothetical protein E1B28_007231 [Marasmius oreades]
MHSNHFQHPAIFDAQTRVQLQRHPDLWFDDGSVVCRAQNTLFRVHVSQLSRHSVCFRDVFVVGTSTDPATSASIVHEDGSNAFEDCPVVILHDSAEDVGNLFTALYDGPKFGNNDREDFRMVSGILRLATKYIIEKLREKALAHLSIAWPSTLKGWDAREDVARTFEMETGNPGRHFYPSPISVINLARQIDALSLLPAAFYDLSRYPFSQIFEQDEDNGLYVNQLSDTEPCSSSSASQSSLSLLDTQRLCLGKESVQHTITSLIQAMRLSQTIRNTTQYQTVFSLSHPLAVPNTANPFAISPHPHRYRRSPSSFVCISAAACRKDFNELVDLATQHYIFDRERGCCDPLYVAEELGQLKSSEFSNFESPECKACARSLEMWAAKERERMWKGMPSWFGLSHNVGSTSSGSEETRTPPTIDIIIHGHP